MIDHPRRYILKLEAVRFVAHLEGRRSDATGFLLSSHPHGRSNTISVGGDSPNTIPITIFLRPTAFLHPCSSWPPPARLAFSELNRQFLRCASLVPSPAAELTDGILRHPESLSGLPLCEGLR